MIFNLSNNIDNNIHAETIGEDIIELFNNLENTIKSSISDTFNKPVKNILKFLSGTFVIMIIYKVLESLMQGTPFSFYLIRKSLLFVFVCSFLSWGNFDKYIFKNLEILFGYIPTMFLDGQDTGSLLKSIISQIGEAIDLIWQTVGFNWSGAFRAIFALLTTIGLLGLTMAILSTAFLIIIRFYLTLALSSIFIAFAFYSFTRQFTLGAIRTILVEIVNMTFLCVFLKIYGDVVIKLLTKSSSTDDFFTYIAISSFSVVGIVLIRQMTSLSQSIMGGSISGLGEMGRAAQSTMFAGRVMSAFVSPFKK